jgi:hypothetical protein
VYKQHSIKDSEDQEPTVSPLSTLKTETRRVSRALTVVSLFLTIFLPIAIGFFGG